MEKVLFSNSFNQTEYLRTMAKLGHNTFGLRVMNESEICSFVLMHFGAFPKGTFISGKEEDYIYYSLSGIAYNDAKNMRAAIDSFRDCVIGEVEQSFEKYLSDDFLDKKELIKNYYYQYKKYKEEHALYDKNDLINYILYKNIKLEIEVNYFEECGISDLFLAMLKQTFAVVKPVSLPDVFQKQTKKIHFVKAYGKQCEDDFVLSTIMKNKYRLDECQIVLTNSSDATDLYRLLDSIKVPYTTTVGVPFITTKTGKLLSHLFKLENGHFGVDGYKQLFNCSAFNTQPFKEVLVSDRSYRDFIKYAGWLRLSFDTDESIIHDELYTSEIATALHMLQKALYAGRASFIDAFLFEKEPSDEVLISEIKKIEDIGKQYSIDIVDLLTELLNKRIDKRISDSSKLHVTSLDSAFSSLRKYNFLIGLDSHYPGGPQENYLIYDDEYQNTGSNLYISKEIVRRKETLLRTFIEACPELYISYPYFEIDSLEDNNPSSVVFDIYQGDISSMTKYGYDDLSLFENKEVCKARINNQKNEHKTLSSNIQYDETILLNKEYSPSSFHSFFETENKLAFIISNFFEINIEDEDDPFVIMAPNDKGTMIHSVMERFDKQKVSFEEFKAKADKEFEKFMLMKPPLIPSSRQKAKDDYNRLIENLYKTDPGNHHVFSEVFLRNEINGIHFKGTFDRLEKDNMGRYILVDYKTGKKINHKKEDVISCIQGLIYAYLIEHADPVEQKWLSGIKVDRIEFRYPENGTTVIITYNEEHLKELFKCIDVFKDAIKNHDLVCHYDLDRKSVV